MDGVMRKFGPQASLPTSPPGRSSRAIHVPPDRVAYMASQQAETIPEEGAEPIHAAAPQAVPEEPEEPPQANWKIVALMVRAVQRFQSSMNPKVDFRKRSAPSPYPRGRPSERRLMSDPSPGSSSLVHSGPGVGSRRIGSGGLDGKPSPKKAPSHRGHMTSYLFKPLSSTDSQKSLSPR